MQEFILIMEPKARQSRQGNLTSKGSFLRGSCCKEAESMCTELIKTTGPFQGDPEKPSVVRLLLLNIPSAKPAPRAWMPVVMHLLNKNSTSCQVLSETLEVR